MTVCIAAICHRGYQEGEWIVGAADRMMTVGDGVNDMEYEPPIRKLHWLVNASPPNVLAMVAGNMTAHASILPLVKAELATRERVSVEEAADAYGTAFRKFRSKRAEREVLEPLGLNYERFLNEQNGMRQEFIDYVTGRLQNYHLGAEAIIAGVDDTGAHIYRIADPGHPYCYDSGGFVAIGIGAANAESQLMLERYAPHWHFRRALFSLYTAKLRGETAPGVGGETDVCWVGPKQAYQSHETHELMTVLRTAFDKKQSRDEQSRIDANKEISAFLDNQVKTIADEGSATESTEKPEQVEG